MANHAGPGNQALASTYDGPLLASTTWSGEVNGTVTRSFDDDSRVASEQVAGGTPVVFSYDPDGLVEQVTAGSAVLEVELDPNAPRIAGTTLGVVTDEITYDPLLGEVVGYRALANGAPLLEVSYTRDALGRIASRTESVQGGPPVAHEYVYDARGRLAQVKENGNLVSSYELDQNGNRTGGFTAGQGAVSASYDEQDRLLEYATTARGLAQYTYTANGDLRTKTDLDGTTTYEYDANGNLRWVQLPNGDEVEYAVDGLGRRIGKKVNGQWVRRFLYRDRLEPVAELDSAGNLVSEFVYATTPHSPDAMRKNGTTYRLIKDHLGSVRLVVDAGTGVVVEEIAYDEFGTPTAAPAFQPFGFAGGEMDAGTGLTRFGARDYDPWTGRWVAKDPLRFDAGDSNLYGYVLGDPLNLIDPSGLYGTNDCSFYTQRCAESGGPYYCELAARYCEAFPKYPDPEPDRDDDYEGWERCTRLCLQDCDRILGSFRRMTSEEDQCPMEPDPNTDDFWDAQHFTCHAICYPLCASGNFPPQPFP